MKRDIYLKRRGGKARLFKMFCVCGGYLFLYQKDGDGQLKRCYLNRIMDTELAGGEKIWKEEKEMPSLTCAKCGRIIASPMRHHDGRLAFRLRPGFWRKELTRDHRP